MRNIYIETDENFRVTKIHRMPFDPNNGMGYTREELEKKGFFVEEIPSPKNQMGRRSIAMYNPDTKSIYYEYIGINLSDKERADQLENILNWIVTNPMFASVLASQPMTMSLDEEYSSELNTYEKKAAVYLTSQIICGKLDLNECLSMYPQFSEVIKDTLMENGIQV